MAFFTLRKRGTSLGFLYSEEEGALLLAFFTLRERRHFSWLSTLRKWRWGSDLSILTTCNSLVMCVN